MGRSKVKKATSTFRKCGLHFQAEITAVNRSRANRAKRKLKLPKKLKLSKKLKLPKLQPRELPPRGGLRRTPGGGFRIRRKMKLYTAYHGLREVNVVDIGGGRVELEAEHSGLNGDKITLKCIDAQVNGLKWDQHYTARQLAGCAVTVVDIKKNAEYGKQLEQYRRKARLTVDDKKRRNVLRRLVNGVDIHFFTWHLLDFLHGVLKFENVIKSNVLFSVHHVANLTNAFFDRVKMLYGDGGQRGDDAGPLGTADIGGHELGHGWVAMLADLVYEGHAGALNEHFADVLGLCLEWYLDQVFNQDSDKTNDLPNPAEWLVGEDAVGPNGLRNFKNPEANRQPSKYRGKNWVNPRGKYDYGGVHFNSGVANKCFYELCQRIGMLEALLLSFRVLRDKLNRRSTYMDYRDGMLAYAHKRHFTAVKQCLDLVGLTSSAVSDWY